MAKKKDDKLFIRLHDGMPDHPKIEGLSDKAFRLLVETWCWCSRHTTDGHVVATSWAKRGTPAARKELTVAGLFEDDLAGGVIAHDWDDWQRTADEIKEAQQQKKDAGAFGAHIKWHVKRSVVEPECEFCQRNSATNGTRIAGATDER